MAERPTRWCPPRDVRLVIAARGLRTVGYGATSVLLADLLAEDGRTPGEVAALIAVAAAGSALAGLLMGAFADRWGRRASLAVSAALMALAGGVFTLAESYPLLLIAAFIGTVSPSTNDNTPFSGVEQAILAQATPAERHTRIFTAYNFVALLSGAAGGLAAAGLARQSAVSAGDLAFCLYTVLAVATLAVCLRLSPAAEAPAVRPAADVPAAPAAGPAAYQRPPLPRRVRWLAGLFAVDAFAGGLAVQTMLAWWLHHRYGADATRLGLLFFATNLLSALSLLAAPPLARRFGLLATMLVPHAAANVALLFLPLAPGLGTAAALLLLRHALSKIDVPARQAFVAALVAPEHRTTAASLTSMARGVAVCASPMATTALLSSPLTAGGTPLLLAGFLAIGYDAGLWGAFRYRSGDEQAAA